MRRPQGGGDGPEKSGTEKPSLAYRRHQKDIWNGKPSHKYLRLVPHIKGARIVEMGAAEGVLALMLAERGASVAAIERNPGRHLEACRLKARWQDLGRKVGRCRMILGDITDHLDLLKDADTFVAIRAIYYMRDDIDNLIQCVFESGITNVVLCGNPSRAFRYDRYKGNPPDKLGRFNLYASVRGMERLLKDHGYRIDRSIIDGDPIVIGIRE
jgi:hypothetical protein